MRLFVTIYIKPTAWNVPSEKGNLSPRNLLADTTSRFALMLFWHRWGREASQHWHTPASRRSGRRSGLPEIFGILSIDKWTIVVSLLTALLAERRLRCVQTQVCTQATKGKDLNREGCPAGGSNMLPRAC